MNGMMAHQVPQSMKPQTPEPMISANQRSVSRMAGPSLRSSNSRIFCLGTGEAYHVASARPFSMASAVSSPTRL